MRKNKLITITIAILLASSLLFMVIWLNPKTPKGIDMSPILNIEFTGHIDIIDKIANNLSDQLLKKTTSDSGDVTLLFGPPNNRYPNDVFRSIEIWQFKTNDDAMHKYKSYKKIFTDKLAYRRLYKESDEWRNNYFSSYESVHFDYNHGIPCGIVSKPQILVGLLKSNLLIIISYDGYRYYDNYIGEMNGDIVYVSKLLK
jgi:hypothetical protein